MSAEIAGWLSCREGKLPMRYLGIPVSDRMMYASDLMKVGVKVALIIWGKIHTH
jgi:hypothetical protein